MAEHGYLREYDEGWDRGDDRERWRNEDRDRERARNPDRSFMFGDRGGERRRDDDRGFFDRMGDRAREMFSDDDRQYRDTQDDRRSGHYGPEHGYGGFQGDYGRSGSQQGGFGGRGDWDRSPRNFSSHQDDHYRSWRDRQMQALDRDYADYCREREQQFHQDFDSWRRNRQQGSTGQQRQQPQDGGSSDVMELNTPARPGESGE
jgi:hypothetical protein